MLRDTLLPGQSNVFDWITKVLPESWTHRMLTAGPPKLHPDGAPFHLSDFHIKLDHGVALLFAGVIIGVRITFWMVIGGLILTVFLAPPALDALWVNAVGRRGRRRHEAEQRLEGDRHLDRRADPRLERARRVPRAVEDDRSRDRRDDPRAEEGGREGEGRGRARPTPTPCGPRTSRSRTSGSRAGSSLAGLGVIIVAWRVFDIPLHLGLLAVAMTFVLALVACRATGESDITPGGPLGKIMQLTYGVLIPQSSTANLQTAAITASASLSSADLLNDLKSGYLLGANPRRQFLAQAAGILTGTIATTLCYFVLVPDASVLTGTDLKAPAFPAPGAQQWKAVAEVFKYGLGNLHPMSQIAIRYGLLIGAVLAILELTVPKQYKKWVPSPTGIGLGMVLPFFYPLAMFLGAMFGEIATRANKAWAERYIVAIAAGGIAGESIVGVLVQALNNFVLALSVNRRAVPLRSQRMKVVAVALSGSVVVLLGGTSIAACSA